MGAVIVSACRTPIGNFLGGLSGLRAPELGALVVREAVARAGIAPDTVDEVILGNVLTAGLGQASARQAAIGAGLPPSVGALTINKVCGSGLKAVMLADQSIRAGDAGIVIAGGMESMSNAPYLLPKARSGYRMGDATLVDSMIHDGLWDAYSDCHMGHTGELCAREGSVSRERQDEYALRSYQRALTAQEQGWFTPELVCPEVTVGKETQLFCRDEAPRSTSLEALAALRPVFDPQGSVTAGNSSKLSDGAAAVCVMSEAEAESRQLRPLARIVAGATHSREPERVMMAPEGAVRKCLQRAGWDDADLYEINEPFAAATVALIDALKLDPERVNVAGGAVALGHPIGATGCRILVTLLNQLERLNYRRGLAALCLGGGEAVALAVERVP